jgi:hypothetical protein
VKSASDFSAVRGTGEPFLAANLGKNALQPGLQSAEQVYGASVPRYLSLSLAAFQKNRSRSPAWIESLAVSDTGALRRGLRTLRTRV